MQDKDINNIENNNKPTYIPEKKDNSENTTLVFGTLTFIILFFIGGLILQYIFVYALSGYFNVDSNDVIKASTGVDFNTYSVGVRNAALLSTAWANFLAYFITLIGMIIVLRKFLFQVFKKIFEGNRKEVLKRILIILGLGILFAGIALGIDKLFSLFTKSSNNQNLIVLIIRSNVGFLMVISTVFLAPIVEELFYRKIAFTFLKRFSLPIAYIGCSLLFALPHMLSTNMSSEWILQLIPYLLCGGMLTFIYHINKENIYASIVAHMLNNLMALLLII